MHHFSNGLVPFVSKEKKRKKQMQPNCGDRYYTWHHGGRLVVDPDFEPRGAPVHELDGALGLDGAHRGVHVLGHHVPSVHHGARDVLAVARVALGHHAGRLEHAVGQLRHRQLLVVGLLRRNHGSIRRQHEVDARVRHQVRLEVGEVHVDGAVEAERSC